MWNIEETHSDPHEGFMGNNHHLTFNIPHGGILIGECLMLGVEITLS